MNKGTTVFNTDGKRVLPGGCVEYTCCVTFTTTGTTLTIPVDSDFRRFMLVGAVPLGDVAGDEQIKWNGSSNSDGTAAATQDSTTGAWSIVLTRTGASPTTGGEFWITLKGFP